MLLGKTHQQTDDAKKSRIVEILKSTARPRSVFLWLPAKLEDGRTAWLRRVWRVLADPASLVEGAKSGYACFVNLSDADIRFEHLHDCEYGHPKHSLTREAYAAAGLCAK